MSREQIITQRIISAIENGATTNVMPWHSATFPINGKSGRSYQGINALVLWAERIEKDYSSNQWATYDSWQEVGRQVSKGNKGTLVRFFKYYTDEQLEKLPANKRHQKGFQLFYKVFNEDQCESVEGTDWISPLSSPPEASKEPFAYSDSVVALLDNAGAELVIGADKACYNRKEDIIYMPHRESFISTRHCSRDENFASVLAHELIHWTGSPDRLNRTKGQQYGDLAYAFEELVAELGSAFISAELNFNYQGVPQNAGYIESWLKNLNDDPKMIFKASGLAMQAKHLLMPAKNEETDKLVA